MNIVLIGMPGCGKSTVGVILAKTMLMNFADTDLFVQNSFGKALHEIISEHSNEFFIEAENRILSGLTFENTVIATGGSAVYGKQAMENLKKNAVTVYLKLPLKEIESRIKNIKTRGIAMKKGDSLKTLFNDRSPLYAKFADVTIDCSGLSPEECVDLICKWVKNIKS